MQPLDTPLDENLDSLAVLTADESRPQAVSTAAVGTTAYVFLGSEEGLYATKVDSVTGRPKEGVSYSYTAKYDDPAKNKDSTGKIIRLSTKKTGFKAPVVSGMAGLDITSIASFAAADGVIYTAAYAANTRDLYFLKNLEVAEAPTHDFAGLPTGDLSLVWFEKSATELQLVVAGDDATLIRTFTITPTGNE